MPACSQNFVSHINHLERIQRLTTRFVTGIRHLPYEKGLQRWTFIPRSGDDFGLTWLPPSRSSRVFWILIRTCFFLPPAQRGLRGHPYKVLQGVSHRRKRGSEFSVRNKLPVSVVTAPFVNVFKERLEKVWTEVFPRLPHWLSTSHLHTTHLLFFHLYMLPKSLF